MGTPDSRMVDLAERALRVFAGNVGDGVAASLLPLWHHYGRLSAPEAQLVLERFRSRPATDWLDTGSGPGWAER